MRRSVQTPTRHPHAAPDFPTKPNPDPPKTRIDKQNTHLLPSLLISSRCFVASSSLCPPDRNMIPGTAGGTVLRSTRSVAAATAAGAAAGPLEPGTIMLGLRSMDGRSTLWSSSCWKTAVRTWWVGVGGWGCVLWVVGCVGVMWEGVEPGKSQLINPC